MAEPDTTSIDTSDMAAVHQVFRDAFGGPAELIGTVGSEDVERQILVGDYYAEVLALLREPRQALGMAMLLISHDLAVVDLVCDEVLVLYLGRPVEQGPKETIFRRPQHPYTRALLAAIPTRAVQRGALQGFAGSVPSLIAAPPGCRFAPRCARPP